MTFEQEAIRQPYRYDTLAAGETKVIWREKIAKPNVAFISKVAWDWYADTYINFIIDGKLFEKLERTIDSTEPDEYNPPLIAKKRIEFQAVNRSSAAVTIGVLCDGVFARPLPSL